MWIPDSRYWIVAIVGGTWILDSHRKRVSGIPDSLTCIPDPKAQDSGFHMYNFPGFQFPHAKISQNPEFLTREEFFEKDLSDANNNAASAKSNFSLFKML